MTACPELDPSVPIQFVINAAAGSNDAAFMREVIESVLKAADRRGDLHFGGPADLAPMARASAQKALATRTAVVAVGGDGSLNTVAQAAHAVGCAMGVVPQGSSTTLPARMAFPPTRPRPCACS